MTVYETYRSRIRRRKRERAWRQARPLVVVLGVIAGALLAAALLNAWGLP